MIGLDSFGVRRLVAALDLRRSRLGFVQSLMTHTKKAAEPPSKSGGNPPHSKRYRKTHMPCGRSPRFDNLSTTRRVRRRACGTDQSAAVRSAPCQSAGVAARWSLIDVLDLLPIDTMPTTLATDVSPISETEDQLVSRAVEAISQSRWIVGECAAKWTRRYARGRTDVEFGLLVGLTGDQVYQRRRVWEKFADLSPQFGNLKWSHFYTALGWDDFGECLKWADDMRATVAEMKAWRRALRGEDLTTDATVTEDGETPLVQFVPEQPSWVQDPGDFQSTTRSAGGNGGGSRDTDSITVTGVAREFEAGDAPYSPFRSEALQSPTRTDAGGSSTQVLTADQPSTLQLVKRMTSALQRFTKLASPAFAREYAIETQKCGKPRR